MQVALDKEVRVQRVGQPIHGHVVEPVYAFDRLVVPVGSEVNGNITEIEGVSAGKRMLDALDADFTPARKISVKFTELVLANGERIPVNTIVTPGSGEPIRFVTAADENPKGMKDAASQKAHEAKEEAKKEWNTAMQQVKEPGKIHKIERYAIAQLPVRPQYIDAGTVYFAELQEPLNFGTEPLTPELAASIGSTPPPGSFVHARLLNFAQLVNFSQWRRGGSRYFAATLRRWAPDLSPRHAVERHRASGATRRLYEPQWATANRLSRCSSAGRSGD